MRCATTAETRVLLERLDRRPRRGLKRPRAADSRSCRSGRRIRARCPAITVQLSKRVELADVAAAVGRGGERRGISAEVFLLAVGIAELVDCARRSTRGLERRPRGSTTTDRPDSSPRAPTSRRPASARRSPCRRRRAARNRRRTDSPGPKALVVSRLTSPENGRSVKNVVARLAAESIARPKSGLAGTASSCSTRSTTGAASFRMLRLMWRSRHEVSLWGCSSRAAVSEDFSASG